MIATCSRGAMLADALASLLPQAERAPFPTEFVIVNDGSRDNTPQVLQDFQSKARVPVHIVQGQGTGIAAARNLAVVHSTGRWLACCDDDQIAQPGWLLSLYDAARRSSADFVGGSMHLRLPLGFRITNYGPRARRLLGEAGLDGKEGEFATGHWPATNNVMMRAEAVRRLGAFNTGFTQGGEDTELFTRARSTGCRLWFAPAARMQHMLTERRVTQQGLRWTAMRIGSGDARMHHLRDRNIAPLRHAAVRSAVLILRDLPLLALAAARRRRVAVLDVKCSIWYTEGVLRSLPVLLRPNHSRGRAFLERMDFRRRNGERTA